MPLKRGRFNFPTHIEYGPGAMRDVVKMISDKGFKNGLLVTDKGIEKTGTPQRLVGYFREGGISLSIFNDVKPNPTEQNCHDGVTVYKNNRCEFVVALGGGSPIDAAKVIKLLATHDGPLEKYDDTKGGDRFIQDNMPPLYAIPTTAGTGSEVGRSGVVVIDNKKIIIFSPYLMPDIAVLDPEVTVSLPKSLTASTGVDAFVHSLEAYLVDAFHPLADGIAKEAMTRCYQYLPMACRDGGDLTARGQMLLVSSMGATAFQKGLGLNHAICHALGAMFDVPHGLTNAALMIPVLTFNSRDPAVQKKLALLGELLGVHGGHGTVIRALAAWLVALEMPTDLKIFNIPKDRISEIVDYVMTEPCLPTNPFQPTSTEVADLLKGII